MKWWQHLLIGLAWALALLISISVVFAQGKDGKSFSIVGEDTLFSWGVVGALLVGTWWVSGKFAKYDALVKKVEYIKDLIENRPCIYHKNCDFVEKDEDK